MLELNQTSMKIKIPSLVLLLLIAFIMPVCAIAATPIRDDGQLKYSTLTSTTLSYALKPWGHAVFFQNTAPIVVTGVRVYACRYGDLQANVSIEIWDENFTALYKDVISYEKLPLNSAMSSGSGFLNALSWQNIAIPDHLVTGNFYIVIFTNSYAYSENKHGISIGYTKPSTSSTSHTVKTNPNRIDELILNNKGESYPPTDVDWMIRVLYKEPVTITTVPQTTSMKETVQPTISMQALAQTSPVSTRSIPSPQTSPVSPQSITSPSLTSVPTPTKAAMEIPVVILTIVLSLCVFRRL